MKTKKKIQIIEQSINDWGKSLAQCNDNFTNKCFAHYFYKVHGLNFYDIRSIRNQFFELYCCLGHQSYINGEAVYGGGLGSHHNSRLNKRVILVNTLEELKRTQLREQEQKYL